ncbi:hypothetical protein SEVIR_9G453300v4 [Setaria viridis]|uniref:Uncharacterized protein n=1 Tax=Setaria viridis TaxID=4556 RepID=A0A4U6THL9_SETVI|nr:uncharacterized protein LOC117840431 [Setaria viridis]XP_034576829.1 uncharacterized protein LOC117840431 [Setaria viridis]XP_034576830.1 uncharacterized protein LOC117840431 [Setaria viridis]TKV96806.1 hypothetical protein SEVIR_9G453300v2 [Setaria viridis]
MQNSREEQSLVDHVSSTSDTEECRLLEEELGWARLERQKVLALSAEADEAIWNLGALARRTMQERDEARNQARMLLADLQARNAQMTMLPGASCSRVARPDAFAAAGRSQVLAPAAAFRPLGNTAMLGQHARTGTGWGVASSSGFGHVNLSSSLDAYTVQPSLHGFASSSQDHFDPDMFLVDIAESPQDVVLDATGSSQGQSSGEYGQVAEQMQRPLQWKGKSAQAAVIRGTAGHGHAP